MLSANTTAVRPRAATRSSSVRAHAQIQQTTPVAAATSTGRRSILAATLLALTATVGGQATAAEQVASISTSVPTVYFGNGCFWGRQKEFVDAEKALGRANSDITSVVGYAGGTKTGPDGKVCYYYSDPRTVYERLGHAEVVQLRLDPQPEQLEAEFKRFADTYFKQFRKTNRGMSRLDPQDAGPGYRNVIGIPGGVNSRLFDILKAANVNGMDLREGRGNQFENGRPTEDDLLNTVWVVDSNKLPFYRAERWHQFHNGIGKAFPAGYTQGLKSELEREGRIDPTGCPELPF